MNKKLIIIKKTIRKGTRESGCCFTSCGGSPLIQVPTRKKETLTVKRIKKVK